MMELPTEYTVTKRDLARRRNLRMAVWSAPLALGGVPLVVTLSTLLLFSFTSPTAAVLLFLGLILTAIGFLAGVGISAYFSHRHSEFTKQLTEKIASDGISASEVDWFRKELSSAERRSLKAISERDPLLADTYRDALASRLTATRIVKSSKRELQLMHQRDAKLRQLKGPQEMRVELDKDIRRIEAVRNEASSLLAEAQTRLQIIEAAFVRSGSISESELALKKLSLRARDLPIALEHARLTDEIRRELEEEEKDGEK